MEEALDQLDAADSLNVLEEMKDLRIYSVPASKNR